MEPFVHADTTPALRLHEWEERYPGLVAGFSLRTGGCSQPPYASLNLGLHVGDDPQAVIVNRRRLAQRLGMPFSGWTCAEQVHGTAVCQVTDERRGAGRTDAAEAIAATDGLHTNLPGVLLTSFYADCVPLFFLDPEAKAIGLAHAGWKGTVGRISVEMIRAFAAAYNSKPDQVYVAIGPSIGGCCYEVDEPVISRVRSSTANWQQAVVAKENGRYLLDLPLLNQLILEEAGVPSGRIARTAWCTCCRTDLFFSYRKEAGKTGRMASFIGWKAEGDET